MAGTKGKKKKRCIWCGKPFYTHRKMKVTCGAFCTIRFNKKKSGEI